MQEDQSWGDTTLLNIMSPVEEIQEYQQLCQVLLVTGQWDHNCSCSPFSFYFQAEDLCIAWTKTDQNNGLIQVYEDRNCWAILG